MKKIFMTISLAIIMAISVSANEKQTTTIQDTKDEQELNEYLSSIGTPEEVINDMGYYQKLNIYENSIQEDYVVFDSFEIVNNEEQGLDDTRYISPSELQFEVAYYYHGNNVYSIYPSFYWSGEHDVRNDTFTYLLDGNDWELYADGDETLNIIWKDVNVGGYIRDESYFLGRASDLTMAGASFDIPVGWNMGTYDHVEGHAHAKVEKMNSSAKHSVRVGYADVVEGGNYSVGVSFHIFDFIYSSGGSSFRDTKELLNF